MIHNAALLRAIGCILLMGCVFGIPMVAVAIAAVKQFALGCAEWRTARGWLRVFLVVSGFAAATAIFIVGDCGPLPFAVSLIVYAGFVYASEQLPSTNGKRQDVHNGDSEQVHPCSWPIKAASVGKAEHDSNWHAAG